MGFKTEKKGEVHLIVCPEMIDGIEVKLLESNMKAWLELECPLHVFDFKSTKEIDKGFYRPLSAFNQGLKAKQRMIRSINVSPDLYKIIAADGFTGVLNPQTPKK